MTNGVTEWLTAGKKLKYRFSIRILNKTAKKYFFLIEKYQLSYAQEYKYVQVYKIYMYIISMLGWSCFCTNYCINVA